MKTVLHSLLGTILLLLAAASPAALPAAVQSMLEHAPRSAAQRCSYTRERDNGEEVRRERYHAAGGGAAWTLESVNDEPPSAAELRDYASDASDRERRHPLAFDLRVLVAPDGWRLLESSGDRETWAFRLRPSDELSEDLAAKVRGTLVIDTRRNDPVSIAIENTGPAYVAPLVRIARYRQDLSFAWDEEVGAAVLVRAETHWRGRALGLKVLEKNRSVTYRDYRCAPAPDVVP